MKRRLTGGLGTALLAVLLLVLSACSSSGGGSGSSGSSPGGGGASTPGTGSGTGQSMQALAAAAAKEGSLTWYTTFADKDVRPMIAGFNKVYPKIKINPLRLSADKIPARVITEQKGGKYNADVVSGDSPQIAQLLQAGALQPFNAPDETPLPAGLKLPDGYHTVVYAVTTVIAYNPQVLKQKGLPAPKTWQDLTKPAWKGQFSVNPGGVNWYGSMVASLGHDKAQQLVQALGNNSPRLVESHTQAVTQVQAGEPAATAMAYGYKAASLVKKTPKSLAFVNPVPLPSSLNLIDMVKNAPHPAAAKLFIDWMVSKQGQQAIVDITNHTSLRSDVKNDTTVWNPAKWKPAWGNPDLPSATYNKYVSELKSAFHAP